MEICGYAVTEKLSESSRTLVYRGVHRENGTKGVLKVPHTSYPTSADLTRIRHEYDICSLFNHNKIISVYGIGEYDRNLVLIEEDFNGLPLNQMPRHSERNLIWFLDIAIQLVDALHEIHRQKVIHKNLCPSNILYRPTTGRIKLIDFSIASTSENEFPFTSNKLLPEGSLAYVSPEQTGRIDRHLDYRTDFYSLGIILYELLTGTLPFDAADPLEQVHNHLAKMPVAPQLIDSAIPSTISNIVLKLLEKSPENRYQSCSGLTPDLMRCLIELKDNRSIVDFSVGRKDTQAVFVIPDKLYGRDEELEALLRGYDEACNGEKRVFLVSGPSGIGKTFLIGEMKKIIEARHGVVVSCKADLGPLVTPYGMLIQAFREAIQQAVLGGGKDGQTWQTALNEAFGSHAQVLVDVMPELELMIGRQAPAPELTPVGNRNRFKRLFQKFIQTWVNQVRTLVIFLDDAEKIDSDSLDLIEDLILAPDIAGMIIAAYRPDEIEIEHPLLNGALRIEQAGIAISRLQLTQLSTTAAKTMLSETLYQTAESVAELAKNLLKKTAGNPFQLKQLLSQLYASGQINFNPMSGKWDFDGAFIETMKVLPHVGEMLAELISEFSAAARKLLQFAACIGNSFTLSLLAELSGIDRQQIRIDLSRPFHEGIIIQAPPPPPPQGLNEEFLQFAHDQIQKTIYGLIPAAELEAIHFQIGSLLQRKQPTDSIQLSYEIVGHLNRGAALLTTDEQRIDLAQLNLLAAQKARSATAFFHYYQFSKTGLALLGKNAWRDTYQLALDLTSETAEAAALNQHFKEMDQCFSDVVTYARTHLDKALVYKTKMRACRANNQPDLTIALGRRFLVEIGLALPNGKGRKRLLQEILAMHLITKRASPKVMRALPVLKDRRYLTAMDVLQEMGTAAIETEPALISTIGLFIVRASLSFGNSIASACLGYPVLGFILCGLPTGSIPKGYAYGTLSFELQANLSPERSPIAAFLVHDLIDHWKKHIDTTAAALLEVFHLSRERGELNLAAHAYQSYCYRLFFLGRNLEYSQTSTEAHCEEIARLKNCPLILRQRLLLQTISSLRDQDSKDEPIPHELRLPEDGDDDATTRYIFHVLAAIQAYLFGRYESAALHSSKALPVTTPVRSSIFVPIAAFYLTLALLSLHPSRTALQKAGKMRVVKSNLKKMRRWASWAPENYLHKYHLMMAEWHRISGRNEPAAHHYDQALRQARQQGFLQEEALICERTAHFHVLLGRRHVAVPYLDEALYCYRRWGAEAVASHLNQRYPELTSFRETEPGALTRGLDTISVVKASRTFTGEIVLDELLKKLIIILLENAGAETGFLIMFLQDTWMVKAKAESNRQGVIVHASPITYRDQISQTILNYVIRSKKTVVLNNASQEGIFTADSYVIENKSKSILCMPIEHQGETIGIIYLENSLVAAAFHADRLEILRLLASQAAISIKNAQLYEELEGAFDDLHKEVAKRKETQMQLLHASKLSALGRLSASIAHEFGNPLIGIKYLLDDLRSREQLSEDDKHLIGVGLEECDRMKNLINDLHDLHRPSSGIRRRFNLNDTVRNALLFQRKNLKSTGVAVTADLAEDMPEITAVEDQITQVIVNLTINAADAMRAGGGKLHVSSEYRDGHVHLNIADSGCGIPPELHEHVFEPFFSTKEEVDGTGLGLAIAYSIIKSHDGTISFTSEPGAGSTFSIRLPVS